MAINSCLYLAVNVDSKEVTTIEGLNLDNDKLDKIQEAIIKHGGVQCGFCTPGIVMNIKSFYDHCKKKGYRPDVEEIKKGLEGNLCRCTGYVKIIDAIQSLFTD